MTAIRRTVEHHEVNELLPWFLNQSLLDEERRRVKRHLVSCDECAADLKLLKNMQTTIVQDDLAPLVPKPVPDRIFGSLAHGRPIVNAPTRRPWAFAAVAAAALMAWLTIGLLQNDPHQSGQNSYETATSAAGGTEMDYVFELQFEKNISDADKERVLKKLNANDIVFDIVNDRIRTTIRLPLRSLADLEAYAASIEELSEIQTVNAVAVQLPVRQAP